jgi:hypothetical protein
VKRNEGGHPHRFLAPGARTLRRCSLDGRSRTDSGHPPDRKWKEDRGGRPARPQQAKRRCVLCSVRGASERSENAAGGLFQHPTSFDSCHSDATLQGRNVIGHNHTPIRNKGTPNFRTREYLFPSKKSPHLSAKHIAMMHGILTGIFPPMLPFWNELAYGHWRGTLEQLYLCTLLDRRPLFPTVAMKSMP